MTVGRSGAPPPTAGNHAGKSARWGDGSPAGARWVLPPAAGLALVLAGLGFVIANHDTTVPLVEEGYAGEIVAALAFVLVGGLISRGRPGHPVGRIFVASGGLLALSQASYGYTVYGLYADPGSLPLLHAAAWVSTVAWIPAVALAVVALPLVFPTGRALSPRWRAVGWAGVAAASAGMALVAVGPWEEVIDPAFPLDNPLGVAPLLSDGAGEAVAVAIALTAIAGTLAAAAAAAVSLLIRLRRSRGRERAQLKWFAYAGALVAVLLVVQVLPAVDAPIVEWVGLPLLAVAAAVAILRHRLYDIDVVINRTLVYGLLTATLVGVYALSVLVLGALVRPLTGDSDLAIAASTLLAAAAFGPARARIQHAVDRRFYRRKYDAEQTLEDFAARLRDEMELEALATELRQVVTQTMHPAGLAVWLTPPADAGGAGR